MKSLLMLAVIGAVSLVNVLDAEACHRRRCRRGCGHSCYVQQPCYTNGGYSNGGCQVYGGGYQMQGGYGDQVPVEGYQHPGADYAPAVDQNAPVDNNRNAPPAGNQNAPTDQRVPPADPEPVR